MRAVVRREGRLELDDAFADPAPGQGQVLVRSLACGICGSDLHALHHLEHMAETAKRSGSTTPLRADHDVVFGHEYCAEILDYGPGCSKRLKPGTMVVSRPYAAGPGGLELVGYSNRFPGGFGELMVLQEELLLPVPGGVAPDAAATVEPFAVGIHAVARARLEKRSVALVVGCGPVGLAVIAALKIQGIGPVITADFSPERRAAAALVGADILVDPAVASPHMHWRDHGVLATLSEAAVAADPGRPAVIFECVGAPGLIQAQVDGAPPGTRIVVVGVCMASDSFEPAVAINKQLSLEFAFGYDADEFADTLRLLADGRLPVGALLSGDVGLEGVSGAFERLRSEPSLIKIIVRP